MVDKAIVVRIVGDAGQFAGAMTTAGASVQTFGNQAAAGATKAEASISRLGRTASTIGKVTVLGVAAGLALSAKAAIDFESSFAGVRKTVVASEGGFKNLADDLRTLSTEIPISVNELNRIAELGGQLGIGIGGLPEFVEVIGEIGATTNLSTEEAALGFARLDNILGLGQKSFRELGSTIVDLGNNFATTEDQILTFALRIAPAAATVGIAAEEVLAIATAFSSVGVPAERGGTAVQKAFIAIDEAAISGGQALAVFADVAGVTQEEFRRLAQQDPAKAFELFVTGLGRVRAEGRNVFATLDSVGLGSARVTQALLAMANGSDILTEALQTGSRAWEANIALTEEAEKRFTTTESRITLAKNQMNDLAITIGQKLIPVIGDIADGFADFIYGIENATPVVKAFIGVILGSIAGAQIATTTYKIFSKVIGIDLVTSFGAAGVAAVGLKLAIGGGLLLAIGLIVGAMVKFGQSQKDAKLRVDNLTDALDQQQHGMEEATIETIKAQIVAEGYVGAFNRLGIGLDTYARAVTGNKAAMDIVNSVLEEASVKAGAMEESLYGLAMADREAFANMEASGELDRARQYLTDYDTVLGLTKRDTNDFALAQDNLNQKLREQGRSKDLDAMTKGFESADEAMKEAAISGASVARSLGDIPNAAVLTEDALDDVADALGNYKETLSDAFSETEEKLRGEIDIWGELGEAVKFNVDEIIANISAQLSAQADFQRLLASFDLSPQVRGLFESFSLEQQAGFVMLAQSAPQDAQKLIEFYESRFGPTGEIVTLASELYAGRLPEIIRQGGTTLIRELAAIADQVQAESGASPIEAWLGVLEGAIVDAPDDLRPALISALTTLFADPAGAANTFGIGVDLMQGLIDGLRSMFPELFAVGNETKNTVTTAFKGGFQISSPSKIMMKLGEQVGQGFVSGIEDTFGPLQKLGPGILGLSPRAMAAAGPTSINNARSIDNRYELTINGSRDTGGDAQAALLTARLIGAV